MSLQNENDRLVIVIDDDEAICRAISRILEAKGYEVRAFINAREYLDQRAIPSPACVLVDIRMPGLDGLALIRALRATGDDVAIVAMTAVAHIPTAVEAIKEGAVDLLAKPFAAVELDAAIAHAKETARRALAARQAIVSLWQVFEPLTPREAEVCALVACGFLNKRIGATLGTTEKTVKVHRGRVMQKLRVTSVADLVRLVDELRASADRSLVRVDGLDIVRPSAASRVIEMSDRNRGHARSNLDSVQWTNGQFLGSTNAS